MSSTGGTRRPGSAFARGSPTTSISCRSCSPLCCDNRRTDLLNEVVPFIASPVLREAGKTSTCPQ